jgi:ATP-binding cassette subfamily C protein
MSSGSIETLTMLTIIVAAGLICLAILDYVRARVFMIVGEQFARRLSGPTLEAAVGESLRSQSAASSNAMRDLQELRQFVTGGPVALPIDAAFAPLFLLILVCLHPVYAVVGGIATALMLGLGLMTEIIARRPAALANGAALKSHAEVAAAIRNAEVLESMGMLAAIVARWRRGQNRALALVGIGNSVAQAIAASSRSLRMALQVAVYAIGAILVIEHEVSAGSMMAASIMMGRLLFPFEHMIDGWRQWTNALSALHRLRSLLACASADRSGVGFAAAQGKLAVEGVSFIPRGSDRPVLKNVRFSLEPGEVLGIIGPSGAGKSTLARLLVGLWQPSAGGIFLDGHDVYTWERSSFGAQVGYLPQNAALLDGTVRENIARFADADISEVIAAAKRAEVHDIIGRLPLGYETMVGEAGFELSGGQRQRIALARALFGAPKLLVLDEPNSNVDGAGSQALLNTIREAKKAGTTVIVIAHRMSVMAAADKLLVLRDGVVDQFGPRNAVMKLIAEQGRPSPLPADPKIARLPVELSVVRT